ncbi:MAG TPA: YggS family pyridoxal phosphate-dependent enzyme [Candidatus Limnocylindria bacterium]|nr:YggS family pyridoxal phosphate-dependent enzyme [Candidatus Limnocylindria bacterium]
MSDADDLAAMRARILERVTAAAAVAGRDPAEVEIVAVTKTVAPDRILAAIEAGFTSLGENRVRERAAKANELAPARADAARAAGATPGVASGAALSWHLVGPLQSNKARRAILLFDAIETVDSLALAQRLSRIAGEVRPGRALPVLLQVNIDDDAAKSGYDVSALERELPSILGLPGLKVDGLMTVGRLVDAPALARPTFVALRALSERLRALDDRLGPALSMGMSEDYPIAVEEGATIVRIGRAIFGERHVGPR